MSHTKQLYFIEDQNNIPIMTETLDAMINSQ